MAKSPYYTLLLDSYAAVRIQAHTRTWLQHRRHHRQARLRSRGCNPHPVFPWVLQQSNINKAEIYCRCVPPDTYSGHGGSQVGVCGKVLLAESSMPGGPGPTSARLQDFHVCFPSGAETLRPGRVIRCCVHSGLHTCTGIGDMRTCPRLRRQQAEPRVLLACINPAEAALVDCASGVHLRLRLGGEAWPPRLLYRVYVHGTVAGMSVFENDSAVPAQAGESCVLTAMQNFAG